MKKGEYKAALEFITDYENEEVKDRLFTYYYMMKDGKFGRIQDSVGSSGLESILDHLNNGYLHYLQEGDIPEAHRSFRTAIDLSEKKKEMVLICEASKAVLGIYERFMKSAREETYTSYIDLHREYAYDSYEKEFNYLYDYRIRLRFFYKRGEENPITKKKKEKANIFISKAYSDINSKLYLTNSSFYLKEQKLDSSLHYLNLAKQSNNVRNNYFAEEDRISIRIHEAILLDDQEMTNQALENLKRLDIDASKGFVFQLLNNYKYYWLYRFANQLKLEEEYKKYKFLYDKADAELGDVSARETIFDMEVSTKVKDAEQDLINSIYLIIVLGILLFVTALFLKNSRKKRLIAVQEKEIETQKNLNLLKEQEIGIINAMIEGQEKERQLVAEDLHDNLGSALATLKLHIENLKLGLSKKKVNKEQLFAKTEELIEEAYQKVRSIAHAKSSGVIANEGLLVAIQLMAEKVSAANSIDIEVIHYGLEKSIDNSLEISLFRIIQELTTNIIKHSNADHATINISQDEEGITLLVEDNGIGMNTSKIKLSQGMGLHSIETRVEHLNGEFTIDSTPTKGTTVIVQIPG